MTKQCWQCGKMNPADARYCYDDGVALAVAERGRPAMAAPFPTPFRLRSGRMCANFDELARACWQDWPGAREALCSGALASFFRQIKRPDLVQSAQAALQEPRPDRALDDLLDSVATATLKPALLQVTPAEVDLGKLPIGVDHTFTLRLVNQGQRLLHGTISLDSLWLSLNETASTQEKAIEFQTHLDVPVRVVGRQLRPRSKPLEGQIVVASNGGTYTVLVRADVQAIPFTSGVLAGATTPRQLAEKASACPREAASLFVNGSVSRWYRANNWTYPVQGPVSSGLGAIQQFFEALGLARPPQVELAQNAVQLRGTVGARLQQHINVRTREERSVYALASSNNPWLQIESIMPHGQVAPVGLLVAAMPDRPGETLEAQVSIRANGNQRFVLPVTLAIDGPARCPAPSHLVGEGRGGWGKAPMTSRAAQPSRPANGASLPRPAVPAALAVSPSVRPAILPPASDFSPAPTRPAAVARRSRWKHMVPAALLLLVIAGMVARDLIFSRRAQSTDDLLDPTPRLALHWHAAADDIVKHPSLTFGLDMPAEKDPTGRRKRLTFDEQGRTNNTVVRLDGLEIILGQGPGRWKEAGRPIGPDARGRQRDGRTATWAYDERNVEVTQTANIGPGPSSRLLDTCSVIYTFRNNDRKAHRVGLRFLLDTYIGANDGVPFTIPGDQQLCDTFMDFDKPEAVPDFLQALEHEDLKNPGTVAQVQLRLGGRVEAPARVTLGAWPSVELQKQGHPACKQNETLWEVPVLSMKALTPADSAVVLYWPEQELPPGGTRTLGFAYGLGNLVATEGGGQLAVTVGGSLTADSSFSVTAYVREPAPGQRLTLQLPEGLEIESGPAEQVVPPLPAGARSRNSPVNWRIKALRPGSFMLKVQSSTGVAQTLPVRITQQRIFD